MRPDEEDQGEAIDGRVRLPRIHPHQVCDRGRKGLGKHRIVKHQNAAVPDKERAPDDVQACVPGPIALQQARQAVVRHGLHRLCQGHTGGRCASIEPRGEIEPHQRWQRVSSFVTVGKFQKLEASWRGLHYLVQQTETSAMLKIRVLNISKQELLRDLERAPEFDQSALLKKVYEEEYGTFGGTPFGVLIGDYEFIHHPQDVALLAKLSNIAAAAHAPFIAAASPQLFNMDSFTELSLPRDLAEIFDAVEYAKWKSFRESEDSRYVGLTVPRILLRLPYSPRPVPVETFQFTEDVDASGSLFLWGNAAYAFGACLMNAFAKYH